ncbi:MAG: adenylosuccinate lyase [Bacteroidales bacterium]|jgi:adenylosuccinate lyase|nr:adenylosuccinate lyase [Bacteroidales bacterium]MBO7283734.1 adenylosuccinate lyase [Bacteroidales bacterium]MBR4973984.1 adenylosuccinate lyase [Bacteroidales bacterium]
MLTSITPIDGRYYRQVKELSSYYSEFALIKYRVRIEIEYFIALCEIPLPQLAGFDKSLFAPLRALYQDMTEEDAAAVKEIEKVTNHDVKAVEYFIKKKFDELGISGAYKEFIHFGLTSQDINNTAVPLTLLEGIQDVYLPNLYEVINTLDSLSEEWKNIPMLAHTHGQPASPTRVGKEIDVFTTRIKEQQKTLLSVPYSAKFGGATGNFNAHFVAYPDIDWNDFAKNFVEEILGLKRSYPTTQIEHYDNIAALFDAIKRINNILVDLCRDIWTYISMEYFKQKIKAGEVGSSAMPHKVNPIDFENAEGNFMIANAMCEFLASKLPVSRLQRDLTDSTVLRNVGVPIAHSIIALKSVLKGLNKLILNEEAIEADLNDNWEVVAEAIQTILRREGYPNPYETLKELTRTGQALSAETIEEFINTLNVSDQLKEELKLITPFNYTGR